jgi:hypothetical protein
VVEAEQPDWLGLVAGLHPAHATARPPVRVRTTNRLRGRYVLGMPEDPITEELKLTQREREEAERRRARRVPDEDEAAQHERRAEKARYLAEKLEERAESERRQDD